MRRFKFDMPMVESKYPPKSKNVLWVDVNESTGKVASIKKFKSGKWIDYVQFVPEPEPVVGPADNEIWYTTVDGSVAEFQPIDPFTGEFYNTVVSNVYENNKGIITFQNPLEKFSGDPTLGSLFWDETITINYSDKITSIILPNSVKTLEVFPFLRLKNVQEIIIPNSVTSLGEGVLVSSEVDNHKYIYNGTMAEFKFISTKENSIDTSAGELIIHCTDGDITIPASN